MPPIFEALVGIGGVFSAYCLWRHKFIVEPRKGRKAPREAVIREVKEAVMMVHNGQADTGPENRLARARSAAEPIFRPLVCHHIEQLEIAARRMRQARLVRNTAGLHGDAAKLEKALDAEEDAWDDLEFHRRRFDTHSKHYLVESLWIWHDYGLEFTDLPREAWHRLKSRLRTRSKQKG